MSVLSATTLRERVAHGEIFVPETFDEAQNLWGGKYNLRMADDGMVIPSDTASGARLFKKIRPRATARLSDEGFELHPGETALISSMERLCVPWDLSGLVGPKFTLARHGLLMLTGTVVDPGFGMCQQEGSWVSSDNERLHFLVANLSSTKYHFAPGASIAAIQFLTLDASIESTEWAADIVSTKDVYAEFYNGDAMERRGLGFFSQLEPLKADVEELKTLQVKVDTLAQSTNQLIFFGVFLLAVTILAATLAVFLTFIGNAGVMKTLSGVSWAGAVAALAVSAGSAFIVWLLVNTLSRTSARRASSAGTPVSGGASDARASARGRASTEGAGASTPGDASSDAAEASSARNAPTEPGE